MSAPAGGRARRGPPSDPAHPGPGGLCPQCRHVKVLQSQRSSTFLLCQLSKSDPSYRRYPPQPRMVCPGFER